ncbi:hypothetical protein C8R46DRAFT_1346789 [Mycena filopes]|nr:hypothetical protein C8R46DRAFT_1346789 [Mycena filopes]
MSSSQTQAQSNSKGVALVTGAAQGIGRAIALRLAADGFAVALADLPAKMPLLEALVAQITAVKEGETPGAAAAFGADVSEEGEVRALVEGCVERFGGLDVMVANAGVAGPRQARLVDLSADQWDTVMNTNARGTFLCYKYAGLQMIKQGRGGRIIGASSVAGKKAIATQAPYSASKFAIRGLTQAAALEFGPHGITVNAYAPGAIDTEMSQGIGRAIALRLAADGFDAVAVNDVASNAAKLDELVEEIKNLGRASSKWVADVSQEEAVREMVEGVVRVHGGLDVMVANAGVSGKNLPFVEVSAEEWDRVMNINGRGPFLCYKYAGMQMIKQGRGGRIIGASSVAGKRAIGTQPVYSASKFAVRGLTQAAALEFGPHGITVNAYAPGAIDTPMIASAPGLRDAVINDYTQRSPLKQIGAPTDIASLVSFLASKESQFITGVALVTGAAQGIGRAIALRLAEDGFAVAVNDLASNAEKLDELVEEINNLGQGRGGGVKISKWVADVSEEEAVRGMVEGVVGVHGGLDVMVANAGVQGKNLPFVEVSTEEWERVMNINARGPFLCYKYAGIQMVKQGRGGRIIGASSLAGKQAIGMQAVYSASKFAVRGLTQAAALEFGAHGITVNAYAPGAIDTPMIASAPAAAINEYAQRSPLKRIGAPTDIASLVSFLASKESGFITGQTISINGGIFVD